MTVGKIANLSAGNRFVLVSRTCESKMIGA